MCLQNRVFKPMPCTLSAMRWLFRCIVFTGIPGDIAAISVPRIYHNVRAIKYPTHHQRFDVQRTQDAATANGRWGDGTRTDDGPSCIDATWIRCLIGLLCPSKHHSTHFRVLWTHLDINEHRRHRAHEGIRKSAKSDKVICGFGGLSDALLPHKKKIINPPHGLPLFPGVSEGSFCASLHHGRF